jgi:hypothetical protein
MTIISLALMWKRHTGQRELRILSESMTGERESDWRQKQPELGRLRREKKCQRVSGKA